MKHFLACVALFYAIIYAGLPVMAENQAVALPLDDFVRTELGASQNWVHPITGAIYALKRQDIEKDGTTIIKYQYANIDSMEKEAAEEHIQVAEFIDRKQNSAEIKQVSDFTSSSIYVEGATLLQKSVGSTIISNAFPAPLPIRHIHINSEDVLSSSP